MTTRSSPWPTGVPCWADLSVPDLDAAKAFYSAVLGWTLEDQGADFGHYHLATVGGRQAAGIGPVMQEGQPASWTLYFAADDAAAVEARVTELGGAVLMPTMQVGPMGTMFVGADPTGAAFGVWQPGSHHGAEVVNEPGGLTWEDLRTTEPDRARAFYADLFGFHYETIEGAPEVYRTMHLASGEPPLGGTSGMFEDPDVAASGGQPHWLVYFGVSDMDAAVAASDAHGGRTVTPVFDTPFGRMAGLADPAGAVFWLVETGDADAGQA